MTTSDVVIPDAPPPAPAAKPNGFARLAGVIFNPVETLESIARRPDFLVPLLVILAISFTSVIVLVPRMDYATMFREAWEKQGMAPDKIEAMLKWSVPMSKATTYAAPLIGLGGFAVAAAIILGFCRMLGGEGGFEQSFSIFLYCQVPSLLKSIVTLAVLLGRGGMVTPPDIATAVPSNLGFLTSVKDHAMAFALLSSVDLFTIWTIVLLTIGYAAMSRLSRAKTATLIVSLWLVVVLFKVFGAAMQSLKVGRR